MASVLFLSGILVCAVSSTVLAQTGTWSTGSPMPTARYGAAIGSINGKLYVAGGCCQSFSAPFPRFPVLEVYDPTADTWTGQAPMPTAVYGSAAGVLDSKLYVAGGQASQVQGNELAVLQVYDPVADAWSLNASLPSTRSAGAAGVVDGKLYVAGGLLQSSIPAGVAVVAYDPTVDAWTTQTSTLPTARAFPAGAVVNGIFYVIGGNLPDGTPTAVVEAYHPATDTWSTKAPLPTARIGAAASVINGIIYVAGGYNGANEYSIVEAYDPVTDTWTTQSAMPTARLLPAGGVMNGKFHVIGGLVQSTTNLATNEIFSIAAVLPTKTDECKNGGWQSFGAFKNQGDCVSFVATKGRNQ